MVNCELGRAKYGSLLVVESFVDFLFDFLFKSIGELGVFADELTLRDADVVRATGVGGAVVVGGGIREVGMDDDVAVVRGVLDRSAEVACWACEDLATTCSAFCAMQATFDLLPGAAKEGLVLEVLLEEADSDAAQFAWEVVFELPFEVVLEVL